MVIRHILFSFANTYAGRTAVEPFIRVYNRMWENGANTAMDLKHSVRGAGFWVVHDELESLQKQAIIDLAKFVAHDLAIEGVGLVAAKATEGVAAIS